MSTIPGKLLVDVFGTAAQGIQSVVEKSHFTNIDFNSPSLQQHLPLDVTFVPAYGALNATSIRKLNKTTKIAIAAVLRTLRALPPSSHKFDDVLAKMSQCSIIESDRSGTTERVSKLGMGTEQAFEKSMLGISTDAIALETADGEGAQLPGEGVFETDRIHNWFTNLVKDTEVLSELRCDQTWICQLETDGLRNRLAACVKRQPSHITLLDVSVLRFPSVTEPIFKLYHVKLSAWAQEQRVGLLRTSQSGVVGEFRSRQFRPCMTIIDVMSLKASTTAIREADNLFVETNADQKPDAKVGKSIMNFPQIDAPVLANHGSGASASQGSGAVSPPLQSSVEDQPVGAVVSKDQDDMARVSDAPLSPTSANRDDAQRAASEPRQTVRDASGESDESESASRATASPIPAKAMRDSQNDPRARRKSTFFTDEAPPAYQPPESCPSRSEPQKTIAHPTALQVRHVQTRKPTPPPSVHPHPLTSHQPLLGPTRIVSVSESNI